MLIWTITCTAGILATFTINSAVSLSYTKMTESDGLTSIGETHTWATDLPSLVVKLVLTDFTVDGIADVTVSHKVGGSDVFACVSSFIAPNSGSDSESGCTIPTGYALQTSGNQDSLIMQLTIPRLTVNYNNSLVEFIHSPVSTDQIVDWQNQNIRLTIQNCNLNNFTDAEPDPTISECEYNCSSGFSCTSSCSSTKFYAICRANAEWNVTESTCGDAQCSASDVSFGTPVNTSAAMCGQQLFNCNYSFTCPPSTFALECVNGSWSSLSVSCGKETCNLTSIQNACDGLCQPSSVDKMACGDPLLYNCSSNATLATNLSIICNATNSFNYSGPLCLESEDSPCQDTCNEASIQKICGSCCSYGNISEVKCNEQLEYSCLGALQKSYPVICIGDNLFNQSATLCKDCGSGDGNGLSPSAIAGIVIAVIIVVILAVVLVGIVIGKISLPGSGGDKRVTADVTNKPAETAEGDPGSTKMDERTEMLSESSPL